MKAVRWSTSLLLLATLCQFTIALPRIVRVKRDEEGAFNDQLLADLNPIEHEDSVNDGLDREKRKLPDAAFGAKNAVIGFVFSGIRASQAASERASKNRRLVIPTSPKPISTTTDDTPDFDRARVSVDVPDQLFSSSFTTVTNISKVISEFMMNSARRYSRFAMLFKPILGKALIIKGYEPPRRNTTATSSTRNQV